MGGARGRAVGQKVRKFGSVGGAGERLRIKVWVW